MFNDVYDTDEDEDTVEIDHNAELEQARTLESLDIIPFEVSASYASALYIFGYLGAGDNIGRWAKIKNVGVITDPEDPDFKGDYNGSVGQIVGDFHGRIVIDLGEGYFGWLKAEQYDIVHVFCLAEADEKPLVYLN